MKLVRYQKDATVLWGIEREETIYSLASLPEGEPKWEQLSNEKYRESLERAITHDQLKSIPLDEVRLRPPIEAPSKIISVGLNYAEHAEEQEEDLPEQPLLFSKAPSAVIGPEDTIVLPEMAEQIDYEVELAFVVSQKARRVSATEADEYIAGYTIINDVSARDAQFVDGQFFRGKSFDTFAPVGPGLVVGGFDPNAAEISLEVNGEQKQHSNTSEIVFDVFELFEFITSVMTLEPGDVIATGTPGGVGIFSDPPDLLQAGDVVTCHIEGIGELENPVVAETQ